jgi:hypothetical protein
VARELARSHFVSVASIQDAAKLEALVAVQRLLRQAAGTRVRVCIICIGLQTSNSMLPVVGSLASIPRV